MTESAKAQDDDLLVETDSKIVELVQKELTQEYLRLISRALQEKMRAQASGKDYQLSMPSLRDTAN